MAALLHTATTSYTPTVPSLNPIEHLWEVLEWQIHQHKITSKSLLKQKLWEEWEKILQNSIQCIDGYKRSLLKREVLHAISVYVNCEVFAITILQTFFVSNVYIL